MDGTGPIRDVYDAVADPTRRELLRLLADAEELPVNELTVHFQMGRTAVSKHLALGAFKPNITGGIKDESKSSIRFSNYEPIEKVWLALK